MSLCDLHLLPFSVVCKEPLILSGLCILLRWATTERIFFCQCNTGSLGWWMDILSVNMKPLFSITAAKLVDKNCSCRKSRSAFMDFFRKLPVVRTWEKNDISMTSAPAKSLGAVQSLKRDFSAARGCVARGHFNKNLPLLGMNHENTSPSWPVATQHYFCFLHLVLYSGVPFLIATFIYLTFKGPKAFGSFSRKLQHPQMVESEIFLSDVLAIM